MIGHPDTNRTDALQVYVCTAWGLEEVRGRDARATMRCATMRCVAMLCVVLLLAVSGYASVFTDYDEGRYSAAVAQLEQLKQKDPVAYLSLPYPLLHARTLRLSGDLPAAAQMYEGLSGSPALARFTYLPLARIHRELQHPDRAVAAYQSYLRDPKAADYVLAAHEALKYCVEQNKADSLSAVAQLVQKNSATHRLGQFYLAKSYLLRKENALARSLLLSLLRGKSDDVTNLALSELDRLDGNSLSDADRITRGTLAYHAWNFPLAIKYLEPVAVKAIEHSYFYARSLFFEGRLEESKKAYQVAIGLWPEHAMARTCMYQYANVCLRSGDYETAERLLAKLRSSSKDTLESAAYKTVHALRSQSKLDEALAAIEPYCRSKYLSQRSKAIFLRARIYFQGGRYRETLTDLRQLSLSQSGLNSREVTYWKAITLEKLNQAEEAQSIYRSLAEGQDYPAILAAEKLPAAPSKTAENDSFRLCRLPGPEQRAAVEADYASGNLLAAFLYLHLYEEASELLGSIGNGTWVLLDVDPKNRAERYLAITYLAGLGKRFSTATYYSELFFKAVPRSQSSEKLPVPVLKALFPLPYREEVMRYTGERGLDPFFVLAIMKQESKFKQFARSQSFAFGLMQLIPPTATRLASSLGWQEFSMDRLYEPEVSINLGTRFLADMVAKFGNRIDVIAAGYNSGEANVKRWLDSTSGTEPMEFFSNIDLPETRNYVMLVRSNYDWYRRVYGNAP